MAILNMILKMMRLFEIRVKNDTVYCTPGTTIDLTTAQNVENWEEFKLKPEKQ